MENIWIVVKTDEFRRVLKLDLFASEGDAEEAMKADYGKEVAVARERGELYDNFTIFDVAYLAITPEKGYRWEIFRKKLPTKEQ